jgi:HPt (histidine-containing phosphotransfer) domain-containing protein
MLKKFANTAPQLEVAAYLEGGDPNKAVDNAHTLKGVTGNLSIMPLYTAYTEIVNLLRQGQENEAAEVLKEILPIQEEIISCIKAYE